MKYRQRESEEQQGIDISPLIDMVFILLIFFMVSTTFVKDMDLDIDRPKASTAEPSSTKADPHLHRRAPARPIWMANRCRPG